MFEIAIILSDDQVSSSVSEDMIRNLNVTALLGLLAKFLPYELGTCTTLQQLFCSSQRTDLNSSGDEAP